MLIAYLLRWRIIEINWVSACVVSSGSSELSNIWLGYYSKTSQIFLTKCPVRARATELYLRFLENIPIGSYTQNPWTT